MFGYVRPVAPQLKVMEYEMYRAVYCGLCRAMGRVTGQASRLTLSYDFTLLAMMRMILCDIQPQFERFRCAVHPLKQRSVVPENEALDFAAAVSAVLAYLKNRDDLDDERGWKHIRAVLADFPVSRMKVRGGRRLPENAADAVAERLGVLTELEKAGCTSVDQTADAFGEVLAYIFALGLDDADSAELAQILGRYTGRFIYVCDAADDLPEDIRRGRYNPLAVGWGALAVTEDGVMSDIVRGSLEISLPLDLEGLGRAVERLPEHPLTPIVKNIVYLGLPASMKRVLYGKAEDNGGSGHRADGMTVEF